MNTLMDFSGVQRLLCIGAHPDDIELGAGGLIMQLARNNPELQIHWVVFCGADDIRANEARHSAAKVCTGVAHLDVEIHGFRDAFLPSCGESLKECFEALKNAFSPDLILTHYTLDRHQDHRLIGELTWNTWRDHAILEYEILKWDGDLGQPNVYSPLTPDAARFKVGHVYASFSSQHGKGWFNEETMLALMRVRGVECNAEYAEAFFARKLVV